MSFRNFSKKENILIINFAILSLKYGTSFLMVRFVWLKNLQFRLRELFIQASNCLKKNKYCVNSKSLMCFHVN